MGFCCVFFIVGFVMLSLRIRLLVLFGLSGSGKSMLMNCFLKDYFEKFGFLVLYIMWSFWFGEIDGKEYYFISCDVM